ncbi:hypothetical protein [uncultured Proteiniphilum sp.]|uniref:hypothetical protein n=1 Tax=uncultured Proteiniphilum sp. TaxID=497637 RepID=UPI0026088916|nr:hypothetical protein [uncultured Proteiniphilum sp.]
MVKQFLIYLFCVSITLQSIVGQFMFYDSSTGTFYTFLYSSSSDKKHADTHFSQAAGLTPQKYDNNKNVYKDNIEANTELPKFVRDSVMEHLFSPSNCPNEVMNAFVYFSYLFLGNCFDLFVIEEKINNFVHFYSSFFRNIQIGLPITKIIYPYHNFY